MCECCTWRDRRAARNLTLETYSYVLSSYQPLAIFLFKQNDEEFFFIIHKRHWTILVLKPFQLFFSSFNKYSGNWGEKLFYCKTEWNFCFVNIKCEIQNPKIINYLCHKKNSFFYTLFFFTSTIKCPAIGALGISTVYYHHYFLTINFM